MTALTNRPLSAVDSGWPASKNLNVVPGLDLLSGEQATLEDSIRQQVPQIETVCHIETQIDVDLLQRAVTAVDNLSDKLALLTGLLTYGVHLLDKFPFADKFPLAESLPTIPEPFNSLHGNSGNGGDVIPDIVIGFVPNNNAYYLAQSTALYLSLYREVNGSGVEVDIIGRFAVYASLHPEWTAGERYNMANNAKWSTWLGVAPTDGPGPDPCVYIQENWEKWSELEKKYRLKEGRVGNDKSLTIVSSFLMSRFDFDRQVDLTKMHAAFGSAKGKTDVQGAWHVAIDRFRAANSIPSSLTHINSFNFTSIDDLNPL
ncbi:hypothetical protein BDW75DRAFT_234488 [Aspergillus navahoensis]